jgi:hypothetical protein
MRKASLAGIALLGLFSSDFTTPLRINSNNPLAMTNGEPKKTPAVMRRTCKPVAVS